MKSLSLLLLVLVLFFVGFSSSALGEELVENMPIKPISEKSVPVVAEGQSDIKSSKVLTKRIPLGHAIVLAFPRPFSRVSVANPDVVDQLALSSTQVYLTGKSLGYTTLTLWGKEKQISFVLELIVHFPVEALRQNLSTLFPDEKEVVITTAHDHLVLTGQVASTDIKDKIGAVAGAYAPQKVLNFLKFIHE